MHTWVAQQSVVSPGRCSQTICETELQTVLFDHNEAQTTAMIPLQLYTIVR